MLVEDGWDQEDRRVEMRRVFKQNVKWCPGALGVVFSGQVEIVLIESHFVEEVLARSKGLQVEELLLNGGVNRF
jgi:hypothetical protein